jgi:energy-coupling factor transporter transmembrane protein EcfT
MSAVTDIRLLRVVPGSSPVHRLWAGTKLLALVAISVTLSIVPTWPTVLVESAVVAAGVVLARIPRGARLRVPGWIIIGLGIGAGLALVSGGSPTVDLGPVTIGLGGLGLWARALSVVVIVVTAAMLLSWTTPVGAVAPALARLGAPLRRLRVPVDEWAVATGLALRSLPLLLDEIRTMLAVHRLRAQPEQGRRGRRAVGSAFAMIETILVVSVRRAREMGDAIEARGGWSAPVDDAGPSWSDAVALAVVLAVGVVAVVWFR